MNRFKIEYEPPNKNIYKYNGKLFYNNIKNEDKIEAVDIDNCVWANTKVTSGQIEALVIYTGPHTRMQMNQSEARSKFGLVDNEINNLCKFTIGLMNILALIMIFFQHLNINTPIIFIRYILLFSYIVPLTMKVNMDIAKIF